VDVVFFFLYRCLITLIYGQIGHGGAESCQTTDNKLGLEEMLRKKRNKKR